MNKVTKSLLAVGAISLAAVSAQAQNWAAFTTYTDVQVSAHYDNGTWTAEGGWVVPPALVASFPNANTFSDPVDTSFLAEIPAFPSDGTTAEWGPGFRWLDVTGAYGNTGGAANRSYEGDTYFIRSDYSPFGSPVGWTHVGGGALTPGATYTVAAYSVIGGTKDTMQYSLDAGAHWTPIIDLASVTALGNGVAGFDWLAHSTTDAIGTPGVKDGDTRYRLIIGDAVANAQGNVVVGFFDPNLRSTGGSSDRGRIDGFAVALGSVDVIPEPSTFALAGLGAAALLIARRRR